MLGKDIDNIFFLINLTDEKLENKLSHFDNTLNARGRICSSEDRYHDKRYSKMLWNSLAHQR